MPDLELEARLRCPVCNATVYNLFRRRLRQSSGEPVVAYESVLWPAGGNTAPPADLARLTCPDCGRALIRVAA